MQALEDKIRSLEQFLRARRNQRRGHYGRIMGIGDMSGYGDRHGSPFGVDGFARGEIPTRLGYETPQVRGGAERVTVPGSMHKRQRVPFSSSELAAMEVSYKVSIWIPSIWIIPSVHLIIKKSKQRILTLCEDAGQHRVQHPHQFLRRKNGVRNYTILYAVISIDSQPSFFSQVQQAGVLPVCLFLF